MATPTLRQCAANAIAAVHTASTMFAMAAMLGRHTAQLKMPRLDAYGLFHGEELERIVQLCYPRQLDAARPKGGEPPSLWEEVICAHAVCCDA